MSQKPLTDKSARSSADQSSTETNLNAWIFPESARNIALRYNKVIETILEFITRRDSAQKEFRERRSSEMKTLERDHQKKLKELDGKLSGVQSSVKSILEEARAHLLSQKVSISEVKSSDAKSRGIIDDDPLEKSIRDLIRNAEWLLKCAGSDCRSNIISQKRLGNGDGFREGKGVGMGLLGGCIAIAFFQASGSEVIAVVGFLASIFVPFVFLDHNPRKTMEDGWIKLNNSAHQINADLNQASALGRELQRRALTELRKNHDEEFSWLCRNERADFESMATKLKAAVEDMKCKSRTLIEDAKWSCLPWQDNKWDEWIPPSFPSLCAGFGNVKPIVPDIARDLLNLPLDVAIPAFFPFSESKGVMIISEGSSKDEIAKAIEGFVVRLLAVNPPGKARFTFIDPVGLGNSVAGLMSLADYDEALVNSRAWSESRHIEQRLGEITEHMETVIQKYLRHDYKTIHDYNEQAGEIAEPHRFVVIFDFPTNFNETSARQLVSIAQNGPRCGVYAIILIDSSKPLPHGFSLSELETHTEVVETKNGSWRARDQLLKNWTITFDAAPSPERSNFIKQAVGSLAKDAARVEVPFARLLQLAGMNKNTYWQGSTARKVEVPLGPEGARKARHLVFGEGTAHHGLIVGRTGSGKSNLMHIIVTSLALKYAPQELQLYLIDFKQGVEFKPYADHLLPHAFAIAVESDREFAFSVMERLEHELKIRGDLFRKTGVSNITEYKEKMVEKAESLPRILLLVDEFQEFFREDDSLSRRVATILNQLVLQGRSNGIHVLLGTQSLANVRELSRGTFDQMGVRIALQCSEADSRLILADDNPAARLLSRPGEAIYNDQAGLAEGNKPFQVAMFDKHIDGETILTALRNRAVDQAEEDGKPLNEPVIFAGNELAHIEKSKELNAMINGGSMASTSKTLRLCLGEPVAIRPITCARLARQSGSNLLILSMSEEEAAGMAFSALCSALSQRNPDDIRILIANFFIVETQAAEITDELSGMFPHPITVFSKQRELAQQVRALAEESKRRSDASAGGPTILLFLLGLQRMKPLREEDDSQIYDDTPNLPSSFFAQLIKEGAESGIHVVATCDTLGNAARCIDRRLMNQVGLRVAASMSESDSISLLDSPVASRLNKPHRAIFFDESMPGTLEKFIPFGLPSSGFLQRMAKSLHERDQAAK